jgi:hypothetical protein
MSSLELDEMISKLDLPELVALMRKVADEIELRFMEDENG